MAIGYLQDIIFTVSDTKILTFKEFTHSSSAKFQDHEVIGNKPISEFLGCDLDKSTLKIQLIRSYNINIQEYLDKIQEYEQSGEPLTLVIASRVIGCDKWVIESSSRDYGHIYKNGTLYSVNIDLNLKEYLTSLRFQPNKISTSIVSDKKNNLLNTLVGYAESYAYSSIKGAIGW